MKTFGELGFKISEISLKLRYMDLSKRLNYPSIYTLDDIQNLTISLLDLKNRIIDDNNNWDSCHHIEPINERNFLYWSIESTTVLRTSTIAEFSEKLRKEVRTI